MISLLYSGPRYGSVQFMFSNGKLCKWSRTFKMFNRQFLLAPTFQYTPEYTHFTSCHPPSVKKGFVKGEALRILRTNSSKTMIENLLSDIKFTERESALLKHNNKEEKEILPFVTQYQPSVSSLKEVLMKNWNLIQNQPLLREIFKEPPIISYKKGISLNDMLVRANI